ncbi:MAG: PKD domain-containing protein, partial [Thermoplasmata archaeon]|nr:PKD domain-containing protein [Thermoplasmata archaeon]
PLDGKTEYQLEKWGTILDEISPYWYWSLRNGTVISIHNESKSKELLDLCVVSDTDLIPMVSNNHDTVVIENILNDNYTQIIHIYELLNIAINGNFKGLDINYENIPTALKDQYSNFIENLTDTFHMNGKKIYVSVFPKVSIDEDREGPGAYDYERLGSYADGIRLMAYNLHWSSVEVAGPIVSYPWVEKVVKYATTAMVPEKIILGIPLYSYDWKVDINGRTLDVAQNRSFSEIEKIRNDYDIERKWNSTSRTPYYEYRESNGVRHSLHFCDAESLLHEMKIISEYSLKGISLWKIGGEDPQSLFYLDYLKKSTISDLPPYMNIGYDITGRVGTDIELGPVRGYDIEGVLKDINWDFGDGSVSQVLDPIHNYAKGGFYTAELSVEDDAGNIIKLNKTIKIGPNSDFHIEGDQIQGSRIIFNGSASWDYSGIISYNWDLGDGTYMFHDAPIVEHTYNRPGKFVSKLTIINEDGYVDVEEVTIDIPDVEKPFADAGDDQVIWEDSYLTMDGRGSKDNGMDLNYTWLLSSGLEIYGSIISIFITDPGNFQVKLTVRDGSGLIDQDTIEVKVMDRTTPVINIEYPSVVELGESIFIDASGSHDNVGISNYTWNMGDGIIIYATDHVTFSSDEARRFHITLDVLDEQGNWNSTTFYVDVMDVEPPQASYSIDPTPRSIDDTYLREIWANGEFGINGTIDGVVLANETIIFSLYNITDQSKINNINWYFGDGDKAGGPIVYHQYGQSGVYQVQFVIYDIHLNYYYMNITLLVIPYWNLSVTEVESIAYDIINNTIIEEDDVENEGWINIYSIASIIIVIILGIIISFDIFTLITRLKPGEDLTGRSDRGGNESEKR